jgi:LuxR family maltose regulon positive regulatory protein
MPKKPPQLAKLSRPRLHSPVARERLFELLDKKRQHPVVWVVGPPGAGKTTLTASYLEEATVPAVWYQVDSGDSDPATFFYYLKQGVERLAPSKAKSLRLLTSEYLSDVPGFTRRFIRAAFAQLPEYALLVLDNYQEIAADSSLHAAFASALTEIPPGGNIMVLSRTDPPSAFAEPVLGQIISLVSWEDLRLAPEETQEFALAQGVHDSAVVRTLHLQSAGWIAGLTLMLERMRSGRSLDGIKSAGSLDTVFDYFAGLIFNQQTEDLKDILVRTAFLPRVNAMLAEKVTGKADAIRSIEELHRRHLFVDRNEGEEVSYQYHALFLQFLKRQALRYFTSEQRRAIVHSVALALEQMNRWEEAFALFAEAESWEPAKNQLIKYASRLIASGRWQTLQSWVEALPAEVVQAAPWVQYWFARSRTFVEPLTALEILNGVYLSFEQQGDERGQMLCATAVLEALYFHYRDFKLMDAWIARLTRLLERAIPLATVEEELWVNSMSLMGATYRDPENVVLAKSVHRMEQLLTRTVDQNLIVSVATALHSYAYSVVDVDAERLAIRSARPILGSAELTAGRAAFYLAHEGYSHYVHGRYSEACACYDEADVIVTQHGLYETAFTVAVWRALAQRRSGLLREAADTIRRAEAIPRTSDFTNAPLDFVRAGLELERGNNNAAVSGVLGAQKICETGGAHIALVLVKLVSANILIGAGECNKAAGLLHLARGYVVGPITDHYLGAICLNEAWVAHRMEQFGTRDKLLSEALHRARDPRARVRFRWYGNALSELLPVAMANNIEAEIACGLAREFKVVPQRSDLEQWPWPIKIYTFERFELLIDGLKPIYSRKMPKKVLGLLKALIALGAKDVPEQKLLDALWPDEEGDAARRSLNAAMHRLRKLLSHGEAIRQTGGKVSLDDRFCWVDMAAFEDKLDRAAGAANELDAAIKLYRGTFLGQEEDVFWALPARERLRAKYMHAVGKAGASLERAAAYEKAIEIYLRGIAADNLVEPFYQGLMRCYGQLDRRGEAASAYRRLRQTLSVTLSVEPSIESQRLFAAVTRT